MNILGVSFINFSKKNKDEKRYRYGHYQGVFFVTWIIAMTVPTKKQIEPRA